MHCVRFFYTHCQGCVFKLTAFSLRPKNIKNFEALKNKKVSFASCEHSCTIASSFKNVQTMPTSVYCTVLQYSVTVQRSQWHRTKNSLLASNAAGIGRKLLHFLYFPAILHLEAAHCSLSALSVDSGTTPSVVRGFEGFFIHVPASRFSQQLVLLFKVADFRRTKSFFPNLQAALE